MNITVYLGASVGNDLSYKKAVQKLGAWIGQNGHTLVYGGSKVGLMGAIAQSALAAGGPVIGVEPQFFIDREVQLVGLTELIVTKDMAERKKEMIRLGEAFIVFPGGTGTLEEFSEILSMIALKHLDAPCIFYNLNGYYEYIRLFLDQMIQTGFSTPEKMTGVYFSDNLDEITTILQTPRGK